MLTTEKINTCDGWIQLEPEWNTLLKSSASNTIALTYDWLTTWWDIFGAGRELYLLAVRDGAELIGVAPLLKRRVLQLGVPLGRLEFLASGEDEADEICSEYLDFILQSGRETEAMAAIFGFLAEATDWDEMLLRQMPDASPSLRLLPELSIAAKLKCQVSDDGEAVYLPLQTDWDNLVSTLDRRLRSQLRKDCQLATTDDFEFQVIESAAELETAFATLMRLHQEVWTTRGQPGVFASAKFTDFHRALAVKLLPKNQIQLFVLQAHGEPLAALYSFIYGGRVYFYQSGFARGGPVHSPGTMIRSLAIQWAATKGLEEWDFLKAEPNSYKYRWSDHTRGIVQVRLAKTHPKEAVLTGVHHVADGLRRVKRSLKKTPRSAKK